MFYVYDYLMVVCVFVVLLFYCEYGLIDCYFNSIGTFVKIGMRFTIKLS